MATARDKYVVVMYKGDRMIRESPKILYEYRAWRWVRKQDEWYAAAKRDNELAGVWTADDYTFRLVRICA